MPTSSTSGDQLQVLSVSITDKQDSEDSRQLTAQTSASAGKEGVSDSKPVNASRSGKVEPTTNGSAHKPHRSSVRFDAAPQFAVPATGSAALLARIRSVFHSFPCHSTLMVISC